MLLTKNLLLRFQCCLLLNSKKNEQHLKRKYSLYMEIIISLVILSIQQYLCYWWRNYCCGFNVAYCWICADLQCSSTKGVFFAYTAHIHIERERAGEGWHSVECLGSIFVIVDHESVTWICLWLQENWSVRLKDLHDKNFNIR